MAILQVKRPSIYSIIIMSGVIYSITDTKIPSIIQAVAEYSFEVILLKRITSSEKGHVE